MSRAPLHQDPARAWELRVGELVQRVADLERTVRGVGGGGIDPALIDAKGDLIGATAADTPARLAVGSDGRLLTARASASTGLAWEAPVLSRSTPDTTVVSSTAETALCSPSLGPFVAGDRIEMEAWGQCQNNSAGAVTYTFRVRHGGVSGTLIFDTAALSFAADSQRRAFRLTLVAEVVAAANDVDFYARLVTGSASAATRMGASSNNLIGMSTITTLDWTSAQNLTFTVQMGTSDPNANTVLRGYSVRRLSST